MITVNLWCKNRYRLNGQVWEAWVFDMFSQRFGTHSFQVYIVSFGPGTPRYVRSIKDGEPRFVWDLERLLDLVVERIIK